MHKFSPSWQTNWDKKVHNYLPILAVVVVFGGLGTALLLTSHAATPVASLQAESGTVSATASNVADTTASDGHAVKFGSGSGGGAASCQAPANTPGGPDGLGGCFPGAFNTGYPHGLPGDTRTPVTLTNYTGLCDIRTDNLVIDSKLLNCGGMLVYAKNVTIKNSKIVGPILTNADDASLTITDTEVDGSSDHSQTTGDGNLTLLRINAYGNQHEVHCSYNCSVQDSWLHDNYDGGALGWHENGFITNGGADFTIRHNSVYCTGGCTGDITLIPDDNVTNMTIDRNLLVASPSSAFCLYPSSNHPGKPGTVQQIKVTNNVFQHGSNNKCATYGPIAGWDTPNSNPGTDGYGNVWSGNKWDDGTTLNP